MKDGWFDRTLGFERLTDEIEREILARPGVLRTGKVIEVIGTLVKVGGLDVSLGELCELRTPAGALLQHAEVIGFTRDCALLSPFSRLTDISRSTQVVGLGRSLAVKVGDMLLGRVIDSPAIPSTAAPRSNPTRCSRCSRRRPSR